MYSTSVDSGLGHQINFGKLDALTCGAVIPCAVEVDATEEQRYVANRWRGRCELIDINLSSLKIYPSV